MTDPSLHRPTLKRRSVSESDTDPMNSTANPRSYPPGRTESQPNVSGLGFITEPERRHQARKIHYESRIAGIMERFEGMKVEINEWKTSNESRVRGCDQRSSIFTNYINYPKIWLKMP